MLLKELCWLFESILRVLAINAFIVELGRWSFHLREHLEHIVCCELPSSDESKEEGTVWCQSSVQSELHHQWLCVRKLLLLTSVEGHWNKKVFTKNSFNDLQVLVWVICLTERLLSSYFAWTCIHEPSWSWSSLASWKWSVRIDLAAIVQSLFLFFCAFLEEDFPENIFLLLMGIVVLHVVVMRLIKHAIRVVVAIWILVSDSPRLAHRWVWVGTVDTTWTSSCHVSARLPVVSLAGYQQYALVEAADHGYLWWLLLLNLWRLRSSRLWWSSWLPWLLCRILWRHHLTFLSQGLLRSHLLLALLDFHLVWASEDILMLRGSVGTGPLLEEDLAVILVALLRIHGVGQQLLLLLVKRLTLASTESMLVGCQCLSIMHRSRGRWPLPLSLLAVKLRSHCLYHLSLSIVGGLHQTNSRPSSSYELSWYWRSVGISTSHAHFVAGSAAVWQRRLVIHVLASLVDQAVLCTILRQDRIRSLLVLLLLLHTILLRIVLSLLVHLESLLTATAYQLCSLMVYLHLYSIRISLRNRRLEGWMWLQSAWLCSLLFWCLIGECSWWFML